MELMNELIGAESAIASGEVPPAVLGQILPPLVLLLAPMAPYLAAELWQQLGNEGEVLRQPWPKFDEALAREDEIEVPVQINGKLRSVVRVAAGTEQDAMREAALADAKIRALVEGKQIVKVIVVPGKTVNLVVK